MGLRLAWKNAGNGVSKQNLLQAGPGGGDVPPVGQFAGTRMHSVRLLAESLEWRCACSGLQSANIERHQRQTKKVIDFMTKHRWLGSMARLFNNQQTRKRAQRRCPVVAAESLEMKVLLAADTLGLIQGIVFNDVSDNGLTSEDPRLAAATVQLYRDGGNMSFDNGGADDTLVGSVTTIAGGAFSFPDLAAGRYFVRQQAIVGYIQHSGDDVVVVDISPAEALGTSGILIDDFSFPVGGQSLTANAAGLVTDSSFSPSATSIGGERDMSVTATSGQVEYAANGPAFLNFLAYNAAFGATGRSTVVWDGPDNNATTLDPSGLSGADLTAAGETGFLIAVGTDSIVALTVNVHSGPADSSTVDVNIPISAIGTLYFVPYSSFTTSTGAGADFSNVGAIELLTEAPSPGTQVVQGILQSQTPTSFEVNFANFIPMTLGNLVFNDINNNGVFDSATETGIDAVTMTLFADTNGNNAFDNGIDLQVSTTITSGGGLYSFGNLFPGAYIVRIDASNFGVGGRLEGFHSSTGNGVAPDADVNSTDNDDNGDALADAIVSQAITLTNGAEPTNDGDSDPNTNLSLDFGVFPGVDIVVTKTGSASPIIAGSGPGNLVYTVTASNSGPGTATGLTISDTAVLAVNLPSGVTFVSAVGSGSTAFNSTTGIWTIGSLASGATASLTVTLTVNASAANDLVINNTASLLAVNQPDSNQNNDSASVSTDVDRIVDIAVTKSSSPATVTAGSGAGNMVFHVTARNNGPSNASGVSILDTNILSANLPAGVSFVSAIGSGTTAFNASTGVWTIGNMAPGGSEILTVTLTAGASVTHNTRITNTAALNSVIESDSNALNNSQSTFADIIRDVDIVVTKSASVNSVIAGSGPGNLVFTITAQNGGPSNASGVTLLDTEILNSALPAGVTFVSAVGSGGSSFNSSNGVWTIGNIATGAAETLTVTLTVGAAAADGQIINNTASLVTLNENDRNLTNNSQTASATVARNVDIQVTKIAAPATVIAGSGAGNLVYTITARNNGISNASGVTIRDADLQAANLPTGVTFVSATGSGSSTYSPTTGIWTIGNLTVGSSATLTVRLTVDSSASDTLVINNTASLVNVNEVDTVSTNNSQSVLTNVDRRVDLAVTKSTTNNPVIAGSGVGNLVYTITTRNNGPSDASGVSVSDNALLTANLPVGVTFVSAVGDGGSTFNQATGRWTIGNLSASAVRTLTVTVTVGAAAVPQTYNNTVQVTSVNETDSNLNNNSASTSTVFSRSIDIQVTKTAPAGPVIAGSGQGNLVYTVTARNIGPSNATGVVISDTGILAANLPAGVTFVSATGSNNTTFDSATGLWTVGSLAKNGTATLNVVLTVGATASDSLVISNTAWLSTVIETDSNTLNNSQTVTTNVDRSVDIVVTKTANAATVAAGSGVGNLVYTVTARNTGVSDATGVTVADPGVVTANLPTGVTFVSAVGSDGSTFNNVTGIWTVGNLSVGASRTLTITLTVGFTAADGLAINNTATVASVNEAESNLNNNSRTASSRVIGYVDLVVVKTGAPDPVLSPGILTYTVLVTNTGTASATGVVLTDNLGPGMTFSSGTATQGTISYAHGIVTTSIGTLAAGASATLTLFASVNVAIDGTLVNTAAATSNQSDRNPNDNTSSIQTRVNLAPTSVSGVVFQDLNRNRTRDAGEKLLPGVQIVLFGTDIHGVAVIRQVVTNSNGEYAFTDLVPGKYNVYEIQPGFYFDGDEVAGTGATGTVAADAFLNLRLVQGINAIGFNFTEGVEDLSQRPFLASSQNAGQTQIVQLPAGGSGSLSGQVATDSNRSNTFDNGDVGIPGVIVTLAGIDSTGNPVLIHQSTDSLGRFSFVKLPAGQYSLLETQPKGKTDGAEQAGTILPGKVLDNIFSAISLPNGGSGTGYIFLELPATTATTVTFPTILTPTTNNVGLRPTFSWTPVTTAARYDVWVSQIAGNVGVVYRNENVSGTSITLPTDLAFGSHRVWVRSVNTSGLAGPWSQPLAFDVATQANALQVLSASMNARATLDWANVPNATSYDMRLINVETGAVLANVTGLPSSQYSGLSILPPGRYRYFVRGNTTAAKGLWSDGFDYTILSVPTPKSVTGTDTATPTLHWNPVKGATMYEVWLSDLSATSGSQRVASVDKTNATSLPMPTSLNLGNYRYWVRAIDSQGKMTTWSLPTDFKVETAGRILSPSGTTNSTAPTFKWNSVPGAVRYDLWVSDQSGRLYVREQNIIGTSYTSSRGFANGEYRVWVMPVGATASGKWSSPSNFTVNVVARPKFASPGAITNSTPTINWTASTNAARYELWVDKVGGSSKVIHQTNITANSHIVSAPLPSGTYRAWVRAFDASGAASVWSLALDFRVA